MARLHQKKLTFDKGKYDVFGNYSLFLKHVKEILKREGSNEDESSYCNFHELLDHLENSDHIDVFVFKVASIFFAVEIKCILIHAQVAAFGEAGVDLEGEAGRVVKAAHTLIRLFNHVADPELKGQEKCHLDPLSASHAVKLVTKYGIVPDLRKEQLEIQQNDSNDQLIKDLEALVEEKGTLQETALLAGAAIVALIQVRIFTSWGNLDKIVTGWQPE